MGGYPWFIPVMGGLFPVLYPEVYNSGTGYT